jgi:uncharacterized membrane protein
LKAGLASGALIFAFPVLVLAGIWAGVDRRILALALAALALARWGGTLKKQGLPALGLVAAVLIGCACLRSDLSLKAYPIAVNVGLLAFFAASLRGGPTAVERLARLKEPDLDEAGVRYTRTVTKIWCVFFVANAAASLATALWASEKIWALYNGLVSYGLMGALFAGEWLVRRRVRAQRKEVS